MLTLSRFRTLADSFGADLQRWPADLRNAAKSLVDASPEARAVLDAARRLDHAIAAASAQEDAGLWPPGEADAALARLRAGVAARLASSQSRRPAARLAELSPGRARWALFFHFRWLGFATGGGFAIVAGLFVGSMYASAPASEDMLSVLQPAPIHILVD
jgi:hypothetical protein